MDPALLSRSHCLTPALPLPPSLAHSLTLSLSHSHTLTKNRRTAVHLARQAVGAAAVRPHQLGLPSAIPVEGRIDVSNSF